MAGVMSAVRAGVPVPRIIDVLASVAAARLGRFDIDSDTDDTKDAGWLDVTHTLTYVNALRWAWSADPGPAVLRGVLHAAWFVQWTSKFDAAPRPAPVAPHPGSDADAVLTAIRKRDPDQAVALVKGYDGPAAPLRTALTQAAAEDNSTASIMVAHAVKTTTAAITESAAGGRAPLRPRPGSSPRPSASASSTRRLSTRSTSSRAARRVTRRNRNVPAPQAQRRRLSAAGSGRPAGAGRAGRRPGRAR